MSLRKSLFSMDNPLNDSYISKYDLYLNKEYPVSKEAVTSGYFIKPGTHCQKI
jgi:hypothetical protein